MENYTIVSGNLKALEGQPELLKVVEQSMINKIPNGYELESSNYQVAFVDRNTSETEYRFKVVAKPI